MNIKDIVLKKDNQGSLSYEEIKYVVDNYLNDTINDEDMTLFLKSVCKNNMNFEETSHLTKVMIDSGDIIDLSEISGIKVDKHSTGGVGDKVTLILIPIVASTGVKVAKMSGRSLGFTGGTIDKLESIPGFNVNLTIDEFIKQVEGIGAAISSQTGNLVPADKKIYKLRDITNTVSSIPLIASSIMSKKIASGADKIVIDVKVGNGALMDNYEDAKTLANYMVKIGESFNKEVICVLTNMNEPLGYSIGNMLEVEEAVRFLNGIMEPKIKELVILLATIMISIGKNIDSKKAYQEVIESIESKAAYNKLLEIIEAQKGTLRLRNTAKVFSIKASSTGFITKINALKLGEYARIIGAGRINKEDEIDHSVGFILTKKVGDFVTEEEEIMKCYLGNTDIGLKELMNTFTISSIGVPEEPLIYEIIK